MNLSVIQVYYKDGTVCRGARVVLAFHGLGGGMTSPIYTDGYGRATISHHGRGACDIWCNGRVVARGERLPGRTAITAP
jgi:hypothetical protein